VIAPTRNKVGVIHGVFHQRYWHSGIDTRKCLYPLLQQ